MTEGTRLVVVLTAVVGVMTVVVLDETVAFAAEEEDG